MTADGLVPPACNEFDINGKWYCYDDDVNATTCTAGEAPYDPATSAMCLGGTTVIDENFVAWGGALGFAFKLVDGSPAPWDATARGVIGFRITITGALNDLPLRLSFNNSTSDYWAAPQVDLPEVGTYSVLFEDALVPEWADNAGDALDPTHLLELELQVFGGSAFASYGICITELTPILDAS